MSAPQSVAELEDLLSLPPPDVVEMFRQLPGDIAFLGVGGKMGPTMARMARRAADLAGAPRRIIGVSRFSSGGLRERLEGWGIETIACDLLDEAAVQRLPDVPHVVAMTGFKFGATANPALTWVMNCLVPAAICRRFRASRIVAFSTGNVYGLVPIEIAPGVPNPGSRETDPLRPEGEYPITAVGRERMYEYFSLTQGTPTAILRLNYATELRYGVLVDIAQAVAAGQPVDLGMSRVNVLWLADANAMALRALAHVASPARVLNLAGDEILRVREVAEELGRRMNRPAKFRGEEGSQSLLNDGRSAYAVLGRPQVPAARMIEWTADWVARGGESLGKPTHFQVQDGVF